MGILTRMASGHLSRRATGHLGRHQSLPHNTVHNGFAFRTHEFEGPGNTGRHRWRFNFYDVPITYGIIYTQFGNNTYGYLGLRSAATDNGLIRYSSWHTSCIDSGDNWVPEAYGVGVADRVYITFFGTGASTIWYLKAGLVSYLGGISQVINFGSITGSTPAGEYAALADSTDPAFPVAHVFI